MPPTRDRSGVMSRYLKKGEQVVDTVRVTSRGTVMMSALLAGAGAAAGYMTSTVLATGPLAAAVGAGAGAGAGMLIGSMLANLRTRRTTGTRGATLTIALTRQRMLFFRSAWLSNRAADLVREVPLPSVASVVVGSRRAVCRCTSRASPSVRLSESTPTARTSTAISWSTWLTLVASLLTSPVPMPSARTSMRMARSTSVTSACLLATTTSPAPEILLRSGRE